MFQALEQRLPGDPWKGYLWLAVESGPTHFGDSFVAHRNSFLRKEELEMKGTVL